MEIRTSRLKQLLDRGLSSLYYLAGDEELLVDEARQAIVDHAKRAGFSGVRVLDIVDSTWAEVLNETRTESLFGDRDVLEVRLSNRGIDRVATTALESYLNRGSNDAVMLIRDPGFDFRKRRTKWFRMLVDKATVVIADRVTAAQLPTWIQRRAESIGVKLADAALDLLVTTSEGNLYAAAQELEKLHLNFADIEGEITAEHVTAIDASKGDTFELIDAALDGDLRRVGKIADSLQRQDVAVAQVLGALAAQLRRAHRLAHGQTGQVPQRRQRSLENVLGRHSTNGLASLLGECAYVDGQFKGLFRGDAWLSFRALLAAVGGSEASYSGHTSAWTRIDYEQV